MPTHLERYLLGEEDVDDRPLPELVIEHLGGTMMYQDVDDGTRLYRVVDWVYEVKGSRSKQRHTPWRDLQNTIGEHRDFDLGEILSLVDIETSNGIKTVDFTDAEGLYAITQRMSDRSKTVRMVKGYLAKAGVFTDEVRRDPDAAMQAAIERYRREGKSEEWIQMRTASKIARERFTAALRQAVIEELESWHYGIATNDIYLGLWRRTQAQLLEELNLPKKANLRDHQPTLGLLYQRLAEETATEKLGDADYITWKRAREIVKHVAKMIGRQAQETSRYLGVDLATGKKLLRGGKNNRV